MRVDLRRGERVLGALIVEPGRKPVLEHELNLDQLKIRPQVLAVDEGGTSLKVMERVVGNEINAVLRDEHGLEKVAVRKDALGFLDVDDPRRLAGLRTVLIGAGSIGDEPIVAGGLVLELGPFDKVRTFGTRVLDLYSRVDEWVAGTSLKTQRHDHSVEEALYGRYEIPELEVKRGDGAHVASLVPIGAAVIAAEGRIELVGTRDKEPLVYFADGGPQINVTIGGGPNPVHTSHPVFRGITSEGWYWPENVRLGRARPLDAALFKDLLRTVSDLYEF